MNALHWDPEELGTGQEPLWLVLLSWWTALPVVTMRPPRLAIDVAKAGRNMGGQSSGWPRCGCSGSRSKPTQCRMPGLACGSPGSRPGHPGTLQNPVPSETQPEVDVRTKVI